MAAGERAFGPWFGMGARGRVLLGLGALILGCTGSGDPGAPDPDAGVPDRTACTTDDDCDDGRFCNGAEVCDHDADGADERGCVPGVDPCADDRVCLEDVDECRLPRCASPDLDGDGRDAIECGGDDCDDEDPGRFPGNPEVCDAAGHDEDCDPLTFGDRDLDEDGAVDARCCDTSGPTGAQCGRDCDDSRAAQRPGLPEACDGVDNDCDGTVDEGIDRAFYRDVDGDGFGDPEVTVTGVCAPPAGFVETPGDCDDVTAARNPGAPETCDCLDNDCDDTVDEDTVAVRWYLDGDGDGWGSDAAGAILSCVPVEGRIAMGGDCDDTVAARNPSAPETCDSFDNDCDGTVDEGVGAGYWRDADGDGFGDPATLMPGCVPPPGYVDNSLDCDDGERAKNPAAPEVCDRLDNDCDLSVDEGFERTFYRDADGDGFGSPSVTVEACLAPTGYVAVGTDCDDAAPARNPGAPETCDGADNDCDSTVDEDTAAVPWYVDSDGDGFGTDTLPSVRSCDPQPGRVPLAGDCDDAVAGRNPSAPEVCDRLDNDCDDTVDEAVEVAFYRDADGDAFGDASDRVTACSAPAGYVPNATDCDDANAGRNPGNAEACDRVPDNDCNPATRPFDVDGDGHDEAACGGDDCNDDEPTVYPGAPELCDGLDNRCLADGGRSAREDVDGDGYVAPGTPCAGGPLASGDCDDARAEAFPGAGEVCNGLDDDCDGTPDEEPEATAFCARPGTVAECDAGRCTIRACQTPWANCDGDAQNGCEANLQLHSETCGSCGTVCADGGACEAGRCACPSSAPTACGGRCVDVTSDPLDCGSCGNVCPGGGVCVAGRCDCPMGGAVCGGECVDLDADIRHCGACGDSCFDGSCEGGVCVCAGSMPAVCGGRCEDLSGDLLHCGACDATCFGGSCAGGICTCGAGETLCEGTCIDTDADTGNCGACGVTCVPGAACVAGACSPSLDWVRAFGGGEEDQAADVVVDAAGNSTFLVRYKGTVDLGGGLVGSLNDDAAVVSYAPDGSLRHHTVLDTPDSVGVAHGVALLPGGDVATLHTQNGQPVVSRVSPTGAIAWQQPFGVGTNVEGGIPYDLATTPGGDLVVALSFAGSGTVGAFPVSVAAFQDILLAGVAAADGAVQWVWQLGAPAGAPVANAVEVDSAGRIYLVGTFDQAVDFGGGGVFPNGPHDGFLLALDADRSFRWVRIATGPDRVWGEGVTLAGDEPVITVVHWREATVAGTLHAEGSSQTDFTTLARFGAGGAPVWSRHLGNGTYRGIDEQGGALTALGWLQNDTVGIFAPGVDWVYVAVELDAATGAIVHGLRLFPDLNTSRSSACAVAADGTVYGAFSYGAGSVDLPDGTTVGHRGGGNDGVMFRLAP